jgi:hypothetical protein
MRYFTLLALLFTLIQEAKGQLNFWVSFNDKNCNDYSLANPLKFLSKASLERRQKAGVNIDSSDLPVCKSYLTAVQNLGANIIYSSKWLNGACISVADSNILLNIRQLPFVKPQIEQTQGKRSSSAISNYKFETAVMTSMPR